MSRFRILPNGSIEENPVSPAEEKEFQLFYAGVLEREASLRSGAFADNLRSWAAKAREKAASIDTRPAQGDLFG